MRYLPHLLALAGIWSLVVLSPGPDFVVTVSRAAVSRRVGLAAAAGIVAGTAIWASASAVGLQVVLAHYRWVAEVVRLAGAGYLGWLGVRMIVHSRRAVPEPVAASGPPRLGPAWRAGLLADLGNPKAAVFWTSLFAAVLPPTAPVWLWLAAVGVAAVIAAAWYSAVGCAFSVALITGWYRRGKKWVDRVTGGVLVGLAGRLATEH
jgi:threonine efflux protein